MAPKKRPRWRLKGKHPAGDLWRSYSSRKQAGIAKGVILTHTHTQKCRPKQGKLWSVFPIFLTFSVSGSCGLLWLCFCFAVYLLWSKYKTLTISDYKRCYDGCLRLPKWLRRKQRLDAPWWNHWGKNDGKPDVFRGWHVGLCCTCRFLFVKSYHITSYHETMAKIDTHWHIIKPWCILLSFHLMLLYF